MRTRRRNAWWLAGGDGEGMAAKLLLLMLTLNSCWIVRAEGSSVDWSSQCPSKCRCTWVGGKKTADCKDADFRNIPSGLSSEVQVLYLNGNSISTLSKDAFKSVGLVNLQKVFLKNCRIERVDPDAFRDLKIMIELDLSGNSVTTLQMEAFETNERLRELKLSENPLSKLTGTSFPPLMHLKLLDLSDCQLSSFSKKSFSKITNLETLVLSGNQFQYISADILKPLVKLKSLSLAGNPWKCDCRLQSFRDWVKGRNILQDQKCSEPAHLANQRWDMLLHEEFACKPEIVTLQISGKATDALLVYGDVGSDITLECLVHATPTPEVKWVRDGQVLTNSSRSQGKTYLLHISGENDRWVNLTILKSDTEDAGEYTCVGNNRGGVVEKNLTLNFQDVPTGEGVGTGVGGIGGGAYRDQSWIWILVSVIATLVLLITVIMLVCFCSKRRRVKTARAQDLKNEAKLNGSVAGYTECPTQTAKSELPLSTKQNQGTGQHVDHHLLLQRQQHHHRSEHGNSGAHGQNQSDGTTPLLGESYLLSSGGDGGSGDGMTTSGSMSRVRLSSSPTTPGSAPLGLPLLDQANNSSEYPDLLDLPHRSQDSPAGSTASTVPDSSRVVLPQQLNPAVLTTPYDPNRNSMTLNFHHHPHQHGHSVAGRPHSPYAASVASFASEPPHVIVPPANRPGYVTLPRRPRVPSWSPAYVPSPSLCPSPTGSTSTTVSFVNKVHPKYDNLGLRTTADGSSRLSLNKIGDSGQYGSNANVMSPPPNGVSTLGRSQALRSTPIPSLHSPASHLPFAPIEENDGPSTPNGSGNSSGIFPGGTPTTNQGGNSPNKASDPKLSTMPRSWKPQEGAKKSAAKGNQATLKKSLMNGGSKTEDKNANSNNKHVGESDKINPSGSQANHTDNKKVPPKPPPKPTKKAGGGDNEASNGRGSGSAPPDGDSVASKTVQSASQTSEGDDGTEV